MAVYARDPFAISQRMTTATALPTDPDVILPHCACDGAPDRQLRTGRLAALARRHPVPEQNSHPVC